MLEQDRAQGIKWGKLALPLLLSIVGTAFLLYALSACLITKAGISALFYPPDIATTQTTPGCDGNPACQGNNSIVKDTDNVSGHIDAVSPLCHECAFSAPSGPLRKTVLPGDSAYYELVVQNTGDCAGLLTLTAASQQGWELEVIPSSPVNLPRGSVATVTVLHATPTCELSGTVDEATLIVMLDCGSSCGDPASSAIALSTVVSREYGVELTPDRFASAAAGETVHFTHTLTNTGNYTDVFHFAATSSLGSLVSVPITVPLRPCSAKNISASVIVSPAASRGQTDIINITATSEGDPNTRAHVVDRIEVLTSCLRVAIQPGIVKTIPVTKDIISRGTIVTFSHLVTNIGCVADMFNFEVHSARGWDAEAPEARRLEPGLPQEVLFSVTVPSKTWVVSDTLVITVASQLEPDCYITTTDCLRDGRMFMPVIARCACPIGLSRISYNEDFAGSQPPRWISSGAVISPCPWGGRCARLGWPDYGCDSVPINTAWLELTFSTAYNTSSCEGRPRRISLTYEIHTREHRGNDSFEVYLYAHGVKYLIFRETCEGPKVGCNNPPTVTRRRREIDLAHPTDWAGNPINADFLCTDVTLRFENHNGVDNWYNTWTYVSEIEFNW